jgi:hypothetical protein
MRVYISGPMTGLPDLNRTAFDAAEKRLTAQGHFVINPHRIGELFGTAEELSESFEIFYAIDGKDNYILKDELDKRASIARAVMDADLAAVRSCDAIYLLRGWETSRGAKKELAEALRLNLRIWPEE